MEQKSASSSSSRPNRSNQQESGGEHLAFSNRSNQQESGGEHLAFSSSLAPLKVSPLVLTEGFECKITKTHIDEVMKHVTDGICLPKRLRKLEEAYGRGELRNMYHAHYESVLMHHIMIAGAVGPKKSLFATGQAVHHWWAGWFKDAEEPRVQLQAAWYDARIICALDVKRIKYAGQSFEENVYQVH